MKRTIKEFNIENKKVIIRCDFNVPMKDGKIVDDNRIVMSLETIKYAIDKGAKVILLSHLGRIKEESDLEKNNIRPVAVRLAELLNKKVTFVNKTRGVELETAINNMQSGDVLLLQNTRYEDFEGKKESSNNEELGKYWASLGEIFINDAFGTIHRAHASNVGIATYLENGIGFLVEKELRALEVLNNPIRPYVVILGGAKVSDKVGVITNLAEKADKIIIGGGMAFTFLKADNLNIGKSLVDEENIEFCKNILMKYGDKIVLPVDVNSTTEFNNDTPNRNVNVNEILDNEMGMDIGVETINLYKDILKDAKTVVWNGPLGVYEMEKYSRGTKDVLEFITSLDAHVVLGGGDIVAAATELGYKDKVTHASTGGGATLEYLEGKTLPGLESIKEL